MVLLLVYYDTQRPAMRTFAYRNPWWILNNMKFYKLVCDLILVVNYMTHKCIKYIIALQCKF